jgi:hypothetical protein
LCGPQKWHDLPPLGSGPNVPPPPLQILAPPPTEIFSADASDGKKKAPANTTAIINRVINVTLATT